MGLKHITFTCLLSVIWGNINAQIGSASIAKSSLAKLSIAEVTIGTSDLSNCNEVNFACSGVAKKRYIFTGTGNWDQSYNWSDETRPPAILPSDSEIIIDPRINGECRLNILQTITAGAGFKIMEGKVFKVENQLILEQ